MKREGEVEVRVFGRAEKGLGIGGILSILHIMMSASACAPRHSIWITVRPTTERLQHSTPSVTGGTFVGHSAAGGRVPPDCCLAVSQPECSFDWTRMTTTGRAIVEAQTAMSMEVHQSQVLQEGQKVAEQ